MRQKKLSLDDLARELHTGQESPKVGRLTTATDPGRASRGALPAPLWLALEVGDCMEVPYTVKEASVRSMAARWGRRLGAHFTVRKDVGGALRVFRTK